MVPQRAWVYIVERCSPSEISRAALTVIYNGTFYASAGNEDHKRWSVKSLILTRLTLNCLSKVILMLGMQLCSIMAAIAYTPTASEAASLISFMLVSRIPWKWRFLLRFTGNSMAPESSGSFHLRSPFLGKEPQTPIECWWFERINYKTIWIIKDYGL